MRDTVYVVFDIETVPNDRAAAYYQKKTYEAPANYKDPDKIEAAIRTKRHDDMTKGALYWWTGKVVCICASVIGASEPCKSFCLRDEKELLTRFFDWVCMVDQKHGRPTLTGKSSEYFDIPFVTGRCLAHDLGIHEVLRPRYPISDVDKIFGVSARCDQISKLDDYAWGLGIAGKTGHGSNVNELWMAVLQNQECAVEKLEAYCANDNAIAAVLLKRWLKHYIASELPVAAPAGDLDIPFG